MEENGKRRYKEETAANPHDCRDDTKAQCHNPGYDELEHGSSLVFFVWRLIIIRAGIMLGIAAVR
jgi:hypothetical protein